MISNYIPEIDLSERTVARKMKILACAHCHSNSREEPD